MPSYLLSYAKSSEAITCIVVQMFLCFVFNSFHSPLCISISCEIQGKYSIC